jgi:hypothetical protein
MMNDEFNFSFVVHIHIYHEKHKRANGPTQLAHPERGGEMGGEMGGVMGGGNGG